MSVLIENAPPPEGDGQLQRLNYALDAWNAGARPAPAAGARIIGAWRSTISLTDRPHKAALDTESMIDLLTQIEPGDPKRDAVRLVLALLLLRSRALILDSHRAGVMHVRPRGTPKPPEGPEPIAVSDSGLDEATINEVMGELEPLLGLGTLNTQSPQVQVNPASTAATGVSQ